jgi:DNA-binding MarR family transcriptional regulator/GNAT superfamily N-acetyltransferase
MSDDPIAAIRRFSRFYTRRIGLLHERYLGTALTLPEGRLVWELADRGTAAPGRLAAELGLDAGYLSRLVKGLEERGLIARRPDPADARSSQLRLTEAGEAAFATIDSQSRAEVSALVAGLGIADRESLVAALATAEQLLGGAAPDFALRPPRPGDVGHVVSRHGALYAAEYGFDSRFEALVAEIAAAFIRDFDPAREACFIADRGGAVAGSAFLARQDDATAKIRLVYVEPSARGLGIGAALVEACLAFARAQGYRRVTLWTQSILVAARRIYARAGFRLVESTPHRSFGQELVGEMWELALDDAPVMAPQPLPG